MDASTQSTELTGSFTAPAWDRIAPIMAEIEALPLLTRLSDGTLPPEIFRHYILQDALYLKHYARCLAIVAAKAPDNAQVLRFLGSAQKAITVEQGLHASFLTQFGITTADVTSAEPSPTCFAYTNFLLATAYHRSYAVALSSILPCFWIYWHVGEAIKSRPAIEGNAFQAWINTYGDPQFAAGAREVIALTDIAARAASPVERAEMMDVFVRASQYEWMFWDSAWRLETWPV
ncbi:MULTISPECIES: thiaminase II [Rhizobium]|uniref:thiaminase II n=1 Tax=Rhizobium phaseoli TaxID=396 RepID=UPI000A1C0613|nr:thiaminase II [Rhizobium phaseoli]ARM10541.1 TenA family protein [Rhizobium phaseoli Brasil 5]